MEVLAPKKCEMAQGTADSKVWFKLRLARMGLEVWISKDSEKCEGAWT